MAKNNEVQEMTNQEKMKIRYNIIFKKPWVPDAYSAVTLASSFIIKTKDMDYRIFEMPEGLGGGYIVDTPTETKDIPSTEVNFLGTIAQTNAPLTDEAVAIALNKENATTKDTMTDKQRMVMSDKRNEIIDKFMKLMGAKRYDDVDIALGDIKSNNQYVLDVEPEFGGGYIIGTDEELQPLLNLGCEII